MRSVEQRSVEIGRGLHAVPPRETARHYNKFLILIFPLDRETSNRYPYAKLKWLASCFLIVIKVHRASGTL